MLWLNRLLLFVREILIERGILPRPRFYLQRRPVGSVRTALAARGASSFQRRIPLRKLLEAQPLPRG